MKDIIIEYKPVRWFKVKLKRTCPERWDEITPRQLIAFAAAYRQAITSEQMISQVFNINPFIASRLDNFQTFTLLNQLDFITDFKPINTFIIKNIAGFVAPKPRLANMTFGQFIFIDTYFTDYARTNTPETLNKFIAATYIPPKMPFSEQDIEKRAAAVASVNQLIKEAVAINYRLISDWLSESYPLVFQKLPEQDQEKENIPKKKDNARPSSWLKVFDSIVGDDIINSSRYANEPVHNIFRFITRKIKEDIKSKK